MRVRDVALFAVVTAFVAVGCVFAARWIGLDGAPAAADSSPLTLTLEANHLCETRTATGFYIPRLKPDPENGDKDIVSAKSGGWGEVAEIPVHWAVNGGRPPYELIIDGESRDWAGPYEGVAGTASVSCALAFAESYIETRLSGQAWRRYSEEPLVDAGIKTIRAFVTDANGTTTEATFNVQVVLQVSGSGAMLEGGKTYRVFDLLLSPPPGHTIMVGHVESPECEPDLPPDTRCEEGVALHIVDTPAWFGLWLSDGAEAARWRENDRGETVVTSHDSAYATRSPDALDRYIDKLVANVNVVPQPEPTDDHSP